MVTYVAIKAKSATALPKALGGPLAKLTNNLFYGSITGAPLVARLLWIGKSRLREMQDHASFGIGDLMVFSHQHD